MQNYCALGLQLWQKIGMFHPFLISWTLVTVAKLSPQLSSSSPPSQSCFRSQICRWWTHSDELDPHVNHPSEHCELTEEWENGALEYTRRLKIKTHYFSFTIFSTFCVMYSTISYCGLFTGYYEIFRCLLS